MFPRPPSLDLVAGTVGIRGDSSMSGVELVLMALGITNRTRKTGLEKAMTIEEVSVIATFAQRAHKTNIDHQSKIQALSYGRLTMLRWLRDLLELESTSRFRWRLSERGLV